MVRIDLHVGPVRHPGLTAEGAVDRDVDVDVADLRAHCEVVEIDAEVVVVALLTRVERDEVARIIVTVIEVVASADRRAGAVEGAAVGVRPILEFLVVGVACRVGSDGGALTDGDGCTGRGDRYGKAKDGEAGGDGDWAMGHGFNPVDGFRLSGEKAAPRTVRRVV